MLDRWKVNLYCNFTQLKIRKKEAKMAKVPDTQENVQKCICGGCPSYDDCMRDNNEILYCAKEKSACEVPRKGCLCGACPLVAEFGLDKMYYCVMGAEE